MKKITLFTGNNPKDDEDARKCLEKNCIDYVEVTLPKREQTPSIIDDIEYEGIGKIKEYAGSKA